MAEYPVSRKSAMPRVNVLLSEFQNANRAGDGYVDEKFRMSVVGLRSLASWAAANGRLTRRNITCGRLSPSWRISSMMTTSFGKLGEREQKRRPKTISATRHSAVPLYQPTPRDQPLGRTRRSATSKSAPQRNFR